MNANVTTQIVKVCVFGTITGSHANDLIIEGLANADVSLDATNLSHGMCSECFQSLSDD